MKCTSGVSNFTSQCWTWHWGLRLGIFNGSWFWKTYFKRMLVEFFSCWMCWMRQLEKTKVKRTQQKGVPISWCCLQPIINIHLEEAFNSLFNVSCIIAFSSLLFLNVFTFTSPSTFVFVFYILVIVHCFIFGFAFSSLIVFAFVFLQFSSAFVFCI
jgi:hypothetical protein